MLIEKPLPVRSACLDINVARSRYLPPVHRHTRSPDTQTPVKLEVWYLTGRNVPVEALLRSVNVWNEDVRFRIPSLLRYLYFARHSQWRQQRLVR